MTLSRRTLITFCLLLLVVYLLATIGNVREQGGLTTASLFMVLSMAGLLFCWISLCRSQKEVLTCLTGLNKQVRRISQQVDPSCRVECGERSDELGELAASINIMLDSLEASQSALSESEQRYRVLFERAPDSIFIMATEGADAGRIIAANRAATKTRGYEPDELYGKMFKEMNAPESRALGDELLERILQGEWSTGELWHVRKDGTTFPLEVNAGLLKIRGKSFILAFDRDITARKMVEEAGKMHVEQLRQLYSELTRKAQDLAAVNRELEAFNYSVSHDMRGPLTRISGYCQLMLDDTEKLNPDFKEYLSRIYESSCWLDEMVDAMLELSQLTRAKFVTENVDLTCIVSELISELTMAEPGRMVEVHLEPEVIAEGDFNLLKIVMSNLIGNAWKYTAGREKTCIEFGVQRNEQVPVFFVRDNGIGFEMKNATRLFRVFTRLNASQQFAGNGIGLATVQRIVSRHGGKVWAEGQPGQGATFFFTLANDSSVPPS